MKFQRAPVSIIRSIRQVSLARDWMYQRAKSVVPKLASFVPNERAGDAVGLATHEVVSESGGHRYRCTIAGRLVEEANAGAMQARYLDECLDPKIAAAAKPVWDACIDNQLPTYSIVPATDSDGLPVTVEQIYLPYSSDGAKPDCMISMLQACSTEGRFSMRGLLRPGEARAPHHFAVIIDPSLAPPKPAATAAGDATVELEV